MIREKDKLKTNAVCFNSTHRTYVVHIISAYAHLPFSHSVRNYLRFSSFSAIACHVLAHLYIHTVGCLSCIRTHVVSRYLLIY